MVEEIRAFNPDVLWVGMTAPKQEKWTAANASQLRVPVIGSIGAVFDYYAGVTHRAPQWICGPGFGVVVPPSARAASVMAPDIRVGSHVSLVCPPRADAAVASVSPACNTKLMF